VLSRPLTSAYSTCSLSFGLANALLCLSTDDVVYNQALGGPGGAATLDKRQRDIRDELGYIAPPNRKLPPVPGTSYNTCDRMKRGTVISKESKLSLELETSFLNVHSFIDVASLRPQRPENLCMNFLVQSIVVRISLPRAFAKLSRATFG